MRKLGIWTATQGNVDIWKKIVEFEEKLCLLVHKTNYLKKRKFEEVELHCGYKHILLFCFVLFVCLFCFVFLFVCFCFVLFCFVFLFNYINMIDLKADCL